MPDVLQASLKAAAVGRIFIFWVNITIEAFKLSWHIISTSPEKETLEFVRKAVCQNCGNVYNDDDFDVITEKCLCFDCREWTIKKIIFSIYHVWQQACENNPWRSSSYRHCRRHWLDCKKVLKENFTPDPSSNAMNYGKFTAVMAGSIALKRYLEDQKILPDSFWKNDLSIKWPALR